MSTRLSKRRGFLTGLINKSDCFNKMIDPIKTTIHLFFLLNFIKNPFIKNILDDGVSFKTCQIHLNNRKIMNFSKLMHCQFIYFRKLWINEKWFIILTIHN